MMRVLGKLQEVVVAPKLTSAEECNAKGAI